MKHNYTNELELKSILIRIKNARIEKNTTHTSKTIPNDEPDNIKKNKRIDKYIRWHNSLQHKKVKDSKRCKLVQEKLKSKIIELSEQTSVNTLNYEKFGYIIMQMVRHILTKSQFRGYSYFDDFMSDSVYKILKYLDNFDHTKKSEISGQYVNAFAYLSTIIHHAIVYIIKKRKKEQLFIQEQINAKRAELGLPFTDITDYEKCEKKTVKLNNGDVIEQINDKIKEYKDFTKKNILILEYTDELDIDDIAIIEEIKKKNKNVKVMQVKE